MTATMTASALPSAAPRWPTLALFNSLSQRVEPVLLSPNRVFTWYTCGPTVYDSAHLGHARTYVALDALRRVVERRAHAEGGSVFFAMGITDIDDKIIRRAAERGVSAAELTTKYEAEFGDDMRALGVQPPTATLRVTEHMDSIVHLIRGIIESRLAYVTTDGVYFDTQAMGSRYGAGLARPRSAAARSGTATEGRAFGAGVAARADDDLAAAEEPPDVPSESPTKRHANDFALWKRERERASSPASSPSWDSPWGRGRPGWHVECSAMAMSLFGRSLDMHSGGIDLAFPHHCNEIAQCEAFLASPALAATAATFCELFPCSGVSGGGGGAVDPPTTVAAAAAALAGAATHLPAWCPSFVHTGHLHIAGRKMSKSLKNFIAVKQLLAEAQQGAFLPPKLRARGGRASSMPPPVADVFRMFCLSSKYSSSATYSSDRMVEASSRLLRLSDALQDVWSVAAPRPVSDLLDGVTGEPFTARQSTTRAAELPSLVSSSDTATTTPTGTASARKSRSRLRWIARDRQHHEALCAARSAVHAALCNDFDTPSAIGTLIEFAAASHAYAGATSTPLATDGNGSGSSSPVATASDACISPSPADPQIGSLPSLCYESVRFICGEFSWLGFEFPRAVMGGDNDGPHAHPGDAERIAASQSVVSQAAVDALVHVRSELRKVALSLRAPAPPVSSQSTAASPLQVSQQLLALSDRIRDEVIPELGRRPIRDAASASPKRS